VSGRLDNVFGSATKLGLYSASADDVKGLESDKDICDERLEDLDNKPPAKMELKKNEEKIGKKSPVWKYFRKCGDMPDVCICLTCDGKVKSNKGTTTNMMNHLRRHHDWQIEDEIHSDCDGTIFFTSVVVPDLYRYLIKPILHRFIQCCGSGMFYPGSRIRVFVHPGSRISDPGS
jgi:hypothetical protein